MATVKSLLMAALPVVIGIAVYGVAKRFIKVLP
jgi:hypothetical protein